jgi:hypothetical protein
MSYLKSTDSPDSPQPATVVCDWCNTPKLRTEFYQRSGLSHLILQGCKDCRRAAEKAKRGIPRDPHKVHTPSEAWVIERLKAEGIPALPGKALHFAHADVVALGCVLLEVKSASFRQGAFNFPFTPIQVNKRIRGDIIVLVCELFDHQTYHLFDASDPVFFNEHGARKNGIRFVPGNVEAKRIRLRNVLLQPAMDAARDRWSLVWSVFQAKSEALKQEGA